MVSNKPYPYEDILRRLENADGLLPEDPINFLEVIGILESYGHVIQAYSINLRYIADTQFLVLFPFYKYMNGDRSWSKLLHHWGHDRINYEFAEYCMRGMMYHGGGGLDAYLDTPEFVQLASEAIAAKTQGNLLIQGLVKLSPDFLLEQVRQLCYTRALGQFWDIMSEMFLVMDSLRVAGKITTIRDVIHHVRDELVAAAAVPIYYTVEINGKSYEILPKSAGLTFLMDTAVPYVEAVFFRSLPFMGILSYNAQAQQLPGDQSDFIYGALYADPIPAGSAGVPPTLVAKDMARYLPDYLLEYYKTFSRGETDLSVKIITSFQKSMFCVTSAAMLGLCPNALDTTEPQQILENRTHFKAWIDRLMNSGSQLDQVQIKS